ncbi:hyphal tip protein [Agrocybe pediades]|nr:hyphal tip protein [Agrocybe pediades]
MAILYTCLLHVFHFIYSFVLAIRSFWKRHCEAVPQSLRATRQRIPRHLAVLFTVDPTVPLEKAKDIIIESVIDVVSWCRILGIEKLTVYEKNDLLSACLEELRAQLPTSSNDIESSDSDTEYPITPPPSDYSESRPLSPVRSFDNIVPVTSILISNRNEESGTGSKTLYNRRKRKRSRVSTWIQAHSCLHYPM